MPVAQLVQIFETLEQLPAHRQNKTSSRPSHTQSSSTERLRLSLSTMFHPNRRPSKALSSQTSTPSSSLASSPSQSYRNFSRPAPTPTADLSTLFSSAAPTSPSRSCSPNGITGTCLRRRPSRIDLALEAERHADGAENIGLGLFEPRPTSPVPAAAAVGTPLLAAAADGSCCSWPESIAAERTQAPPVVLDGIFEVMEGS